MTLQKHGSYNSHGHNNISIHILKTNIGQNPLQAFSAWFPRIFRTGLLRLYRKKKNSSNPLKR